MANNYSTPNPSAPIYAVLQHSCYICEHRFLGSDELNSHLASAHGLSFTNRSRIPTEAIHSNEFQLINFILPNITAPTFIPDVQIRQGCSVCASHFDNIDQLALHMDVHCRYGGTREEAFALAELHFSFNYFHYRPIPRTTPLDHNEHHDNGGNSSTAGNVVDNNVVGNTVGETINSTIDGETHTVVNASGTTTDGAGPSNRAVSTERTSHSNAARRLRRLQAKKRMIPKRSSE